MGRLIDEDMLMERLGFLNTPQEREENAGQIITLEDFDSIPTAYDVDKVLEELQTEKGYACLGRQCTHCEYYKVCFRGEKAQEVAIDKAIEIVQQCGVSDDVCEWKTDYGFVSDKYKRETGCGHTFYDLHHAVPFKYCPYCGKKIKVVE